MWITEKYQCHTRIEHGRVLSLYSLGRLADAGNRLYLIPLFYGEYVVGLGRMEWSERVQERPQRCENEREICVLQNKESKPGIARCRVVSTVGRR